MKKINNNKFRGNNNAIYSLNYKFDSVCSVGKFSGTALDLIKKYNELAKEAHSNGNYVEMEVFRQYAEHYRKIVTEINERKNIARENNQQTEAPQNKEENCDENAEQPNAVQIANENSENIPSDNISENKTQENTEQTEISGDIIKKTRRRRSFTIVEVAQKTDENKETSHLKRRRSPAKKQNNNEIEAESAENKDAQ